MPKKQGTRIVVVNPMREYGLERYWVPSVTSSALFGTKLMDDFFQVRVSAETWRLSNGVIKTLIALNRIDQEFIAKRTTGYEELKAALGAQSCGDARGMFRPVPLPGAWSGLPCFTVMPVAPFSSTATGLTQHEFGVDNVKAIRESQLYPAACSDAPNAASCRCVVTAASRGAASAGLSRTSSQADFRPMTKAPVLSLICGATRSLPSRDSGTGDDRGGKQRGTQFSLFHRRQFVGNPAGPKFHRQSAAKSGRKSASGYRSQHLHASRRRASGAHPARPVTSSAAEERPPIRKDVFASPPRFPDIRLATRCRSGRYPHDYRPPCDAQRASSCFPMTGAQSIRDEMSRVMPTYQGIREVRKEGDHLQWGGPFLHKAGHFSNMPNGPRALQRSETA